MVKLCSNSDVYNWYWEDLRVQSYKSETVSLNNTETKVSSGHLHWVIFPNNLTPVAVLLFSCFGRRASVMPTAWCASFGPCDILSGKTKQRRCIPLVKTERKVDPIKAVIMQCAPSKATRVSDAWEPRGFVHFHRPHIVMRDLSLTLQAESLFICDCDPGSCSQCSAVLPSVGQSRPDIYLSTSSYVMTIPWRLHVVSPPPSTNPSDG